MTKVADLRKGGGETPSGPNVSRRHVSWGSFPPPLFVPPIRAPATRVFMRSGDACVASRRSREPVDFIDAARRSRRRRRRYNVRTMTAREELREQYCDAGNLNARSAIYRFGDANATPWPWWVFDQIAQHLPADAR